MWYQLQTNNTHPHVFQQETAAAHAALPFSAMGVFFFFPLAFATPRVNVALDVAKLIYLNPIVQYSRSFRAARNSSSTCSPAWTHSMQRFNYSMRETEKRKKIDRFIWRNKEKETIKTGKIMLGADPPFLSLKLPFLIFPPHAHDAETVFIKSKGGQE